MKTALLATVLAFCPALAHAQTVVVGQGAAQSCYQSALTGNPGTLAAIRNCSDAFKSPMVRGDEAATFVNRGVLLMRRGDHIKAERDYQSALRLEPKLAEAHINHGVVLFYQGEDAAALDAYTTAIALKTNKMAEVLFNRALAYERLDRPRDAYYDLKAALELRPDWEQAQQSLARFTVKTRDS